MKVNIMKKYKYNGETKTISFKVSISILELGTEIRDKLYKHFEKLIKNQRLTQDELNWCNGVLEP